MNRIALAVTLAALPLAGCGRHGAAAEPSPAAIGGKPSAPVSVAAALADGSGRVTVRFDAAGRDVRIAIGGAEGLAVTSAAVPVEGAAVAQGEEKALDVAFSPGPGRSFLVVSVSGKFKGSGRRASVASFSAGEPTAGQRTSAGTVVEGARGERVKIVVPRK